jgi:(4S)-4-hydroxy-5-phosphonooxypentane-2,3-dione isomerase
MSFVLVVSIRIKPENVEKWIPLAVENARQSRREPGCRQFDVLVDPKDRTRVLLYEVYDDEKAFDAHQQTPHFKQYLADAVPMLAQRERQVYEKAG